LARVVCDCAGQTTTDVRRPPVTVQVGDPRTGEMRAVLQGVPLQ
jgi:hypothetical protein